ncbi:MAG TPA: hypothetical protein DDZ76_00445, partial [Xanthomonadales bacterium]|nr:hypothetical protein [Xanthomonadales bacterium]
MQAQVASDGRLAEASLRLASEPQSEAEVIDTLHLLGGAPAALVQRHAARPVDAGVEHLARRIIALARAGRPVDALLTDLRARQNADGGFGGASSMASTLLDTSFALVAFRVAGVVEGAEITRALDHLVARVADPAARDWQTGPLSKPYVSAHVLLALQMYSARFQIGAVIDAQRQALIGQQSGGVYAEVLLDTVAALALQLTTTGGTGLTEVRASIRAAQSPDGSWQGDSFLTALALRVLAGEPIPPDTREAGIVLRVRDALTLAMLPAVTVAIEERPDLALLTGADGRVETAGLVAGSYRLRLSREGYAPHMIEGVTLSAGQVRDLGVIDLARAADVAVVFGRVTDAATGTPLAGVDIAVRGAVQASIRTAPDGSFEQVFSTAGEIEISAARSGYQTAQGRGSLVLGQALRFSPALFPEGNPVPTDAALLAKVVDAASGLPLADVAVTLGAAAGRSDGSGAVQLTDLPTGSFTATFVRDGYADSVLTGSLVAGINDVGLVRLQARTTETHSTLSGRVIDAGNGAAIAGATIAIVGSELRTVSAADGRYTIGGIAERPFVALATAPGYASQQVATGSGDANNFQAEFALIRLAGADVSLDGLTMSAPEYDPFTELGVLGTVTNRSAVSEVGLIFNAMVFDAAGGVVRDVPHVQITLNRSFDDTIIRFAPGETRPITIIWGNANDAPGEYRVLFRGSTPDGRVVLEGSTSYRVRSLVRLDGAIVTDPPLIQAGLGQQVNLSADLTNMGNQPIPAGNARLDITLVAQDDRPPLPAKPVFDGSLIAGTPLSRPTGIARDPDGNLYTLNTSPSPQLVRVRPDGTGEVLRALPTVSPGNASLSTPLSLSWHAPNRLRIAWISGWTADLDLDADHAIDGFVAPPAGIQTNSVSAYTFDAAAGREYFGVTQNFRPRALLRDATGAVSVLVDAGLNQAGESQFGPDGRLYVVNISPGAVFRIDPDTGAIEPIWTGLDGSPRGMVVTGDGSIYLGLTSPRSVLRRRPDGQVETFAAGLDASISDLKIGRDGLIYGLASDGSIRRFAADGSNTIFARGIINTVSGLALGPQRGIYAWNATTLRFRSDATGIVSLGNGSQSISDLMPDGPQGPLIVNGTSLFRAIAGDFQPLLARTGQRFRAIAPYGNDVLLGVLDGDRPILARSDRSSFEPIASSPFPQTVLRLHVEADRSLLIVGSDGLTRIRPDGSHQLHARWVNVSATAFDRSNGLLWVNSPSEGLLRIDLASGERTRVRSFLNGMSWGATVDGDGRLLYADASARKLVRHDPVSNTSTDVQVFASPMQPIDVAIASDGAADGVVFVRFLNDSSLRRLDGDGLTLIDTAVTEMLTDADGRVGYRKSVNVFAAPTVGTAPALLGVLIENPSLAAWVDQQSLAAYFTRSQLRYQTPTGAVIRDVFGFRDFLALTATASGDIVLLDSNRELTRIRDDRIERLGRHSTAVDVKALGDEVVLLKREGPFRLTADGQLEPVAIGIPDWAGAYGNFDLRADGAVWSNGSTNEIALTDDGNAVIERYLPFAGATSLAQKRDGGWLIGTGTRIIEIDETGGRSRLFASTNRVNWDLFVRADGSILETTGNDLVGRFDADGTVRPLIGIADNGLAKLISIAEQPGTGALFAMTQQGVAYRERADTLQPFAAGVTQLSS